MVRFTSLKGSDRTITLLVRAGPTVGAPVPYLGGDSTEGRTATPRPELMSSLPDLICSVDVEYRSSSLSPPRSVLADTCARSQTAVSDAMMSSRISTPTEEVPAADHLPTEGIPSAVRPQRLRHGVLAVLWVTAVGLIHLLPALLQGPELGSADLLGVFGLGAVPGGHVFNGLAADQIRAFEPWAWLSWSQVHHGVFPLWNPYSGLGLPLLFNFQSAAASLPMLIGYLTPQRYAFTVVVLTQMLIGGLGVLWMCRRIGLRMLPSTFAATAFMLSGSFSGWLGWPMAGTTCWLGWALGCVIMLIRAPRRCPLRGWARRRPRLHDLRGPP